MVYSKQELWNIDIEIPDSFSAYLEEIGEISNWPFMHKLEFRDKLDEYTPPLFLYTESRDARNYVTGSRIYGGGGSTSAIVGSGARSLFDYEIGDRIDANTRGKVLDAFCKIEFCIDALICIEMGVYSDKLKYSSIKNEFSDGREGLFSTTHKKLSYLKHRGLISKETYNCLVKSKEIRNSLAHQYLPINNYGITTKDYERYGGYGKAIEVIYEAAWINLLSDYVKFQLPVLKWMVTQGIIAK